MWKADVKSILKTIWLMWQCEGRNWITCRFYEIQICFIIQNRETYKSKYNKRKTCYHQYDNILICKWSNSIAQYIKCMMWATSWIIPPSAVIMKIKVLISLALDSRDNLWHNAELLKLYLVPRYCNDLWCSSQQFKKTWT